MRTISLRNEDNIIEFVYIRGNPFYDFEKDAIAF